MVAINRMRIGAYEFAIEAASFRYIIQSWSGPGWDFNFNGPCITNEAKRLFPYGARLYTEAAPLPLQRAEDYTGTELVLPLPYDEISGEALFGLKVWEEHDVSDLQLRFVERHRNSYRIEILATVAPTVLGIPNNCSYPRGWRNSPTMHIRYRSQVGQSASVRRALEPLSS